MGRILAIVAACALSLTLFSMGPVAVLAQDGSGSGSGTGTGTGSGSGTGCSHGYYKTHTDEWFGLGCGSYCGGRSDLDLFGALFARGPGSEAIREASRECLNACTGFSCDDD
jgi:hypothetical protein